MESCDKKIHYISNTIFRKVQAEFKESWYIWYLSDSLRNVSGIIGNMVMGTIKC